MFHTSSFDIQLLQLPQPSDNFALMMEEAALCEACLGPPPPLFDLPPPPRPPDLDPEGCSSQRPMQEGHGLYYDDPHQVCDINAFVIDSNFYFGENLFTLLIVVICSCILVGIMMAVAIVIYRRRSMFRRFYSDGSKSLGSTGRSQILSEPRGLMKELPPPTSMMAKQSEEIGHVYANPSYPASMQIGGLPFYLPPREGSSAEAHQRDIPAMSPNLSPASRPPMEARPSVHLYDTMAWYNNSNNAAVGGGTTSLRPVRGRSTTQKMVENDIGGPIYEDIDRMCSYRGYPPPPLQHPTTMSQPQTAAASEAGTSDSYYNLSGGSSSPRNKSSNNSETSFERLQQRSPTIQPQTQTTSPRTAPKNSMYYYSDTLRKGRVGSDSGISVDTPPPRASMMQPRGSARVNMVQTEAVFNEMTNARIRTGSNRTHRKRIHDTKV